MLTKKTKNIKLAVPIVTLEILQKNKKKINIESQLTYFKVSQSSNNIEFLEVIIEDNTLVLQNSSTFHLGADITASIKFAGEKENINLIEAEIVTIENNYGGVKTIKILACSRLYRLSRTTFSATYLNLSITGIVERIAKRHNLTIEVDSVSKKYESIIQMNETDYSFMKKLALILDYRIIMKGKKLLFKKASYYKKGEIINLDSGLNFIDCIISESATNLVSSVEVIGFDIKTNKAFSSKITTGDEIKILDGKLGSKDTFKNFEKLQTELLISNANPFDIEDAKIIGKSILNRNNSSYMTGNASIHGDPRLGLDSLVNLIKFGTKRDGLYFINNVSHIVSKGFYTCDIVFGRNVFNKKENKEFINAKTKPLEDMKLKAKPGLPIGGLGGGVPSFGGIGKMTAGAGAVAAGASVILATNKIKDLSTSISKKAEEVVDNLSDQVTRKVDDIIKSADDKLSDTSDEIRTAVDNQEKETDEIEEHQENSNNNNEGHNPDNG